MNLGNSAGFGAIRWYRDRLPCWQRATFIIDPNAYLTVQSGNSGITAIAGGNFTMTTSPGSLGDGFFTSGRRDHLVRRGRCNDDARQHRYQHRLLSWRQCSADRGFLQHHPGGQRRDRQCADPAGDRRSADQSRHGIVRCCARTSWLRKPSVSTDRRSYIIAATVPRSRDRPTKPRPSHEAATVPRNRAALVRRSSSPVGALTCTEIRCRCQVWSGANLAVPSPSGAAVMLLSANEAAVGGCRW